MGALWRIKLSPTSLLPRRTTPQLRAIFRDLPLRLLPLRLRPLEKVPCENMSCCGQEECGKGALTGEFVDRTGYLSSEGRSKNLTVSFRTGVVLTTRLAKQ